MRQNIVDDRPCIVIVGNAPINVDLSGFVEAGDIVVRFNEGKNLGVNSGVKTDVLCLCNTGVPARRMIANRMILNSPYYRDLKEVWLPRDAEVHRAFFNKVDPAFSLSESEDYADELLAANKLNRFTVKRFSHEFNQALFAKLSVKSDHSFFCPSTGFMAIEYIMSESRFSGYKKILIGFTFQGWYGHPWAAEEQIVREYSAVQSNLSIIALDKIPLSWSQRWKNIIKERILRKKGRV